jgi:hypothetical protein
VGGCPRLAPRGSSDRPAGDEIGVLAQQGPRRHQPQPIQLPGRSMPNTPQRGVNPASIQADVFQHRGHSQPFTSEG